MQPGRHISNTILSFSLPLLNLTGKKWERNPAFDRWFVQESCQSDECETRLKACLTCDSALRHRRRELQFLVSCTRKFWTTHALDNTISLESLWSVLQYPMYVGSSRPHPSIILYLWHGTERNNWFGTQVEWEHHELTSEVRSQKCHHLIYLVPPLSLPTLSCSPLSLLLLPLFFTFFFPPFSFSLSLLLPLLPLLPFFSLCSPSFSISLPTFLSVSTLLLSALLQEHTAQKLHL